MTCAPLFKESRGFVIVFDNFTAMMDMVMMIPKKKVREYHFIDVRRFFISFSV